MGNQNRTVKESQAAQRLEQVTSDMEWLERAAIKEFCGNMSREQAEAETLAEIRSIRSKRTPMEIEQAEREAREEQIRRAQKNAIKAAKTGTQGQLALGPNPRRP